MIVAGLVLIGSARLKGLVNSYRAGAHCDLVTHDVSALFSVTVTLYLLRKDDFRSYSLKVDISLSDRLILQTYS